MSRLTLPWLITFTMRGHFCVVRPSSLMTLFHMHLMAPPGDRLVRVREHIVAIITMLHADVQMGV